MLLNKRSTLAIEIELGRINRQIAHVAMSLNGFPRKHLYNQIPQTRIFQ